MNEKWVTINGRRVLIKDSGESYQDKRRKFVQEHYNELQPESEEYTQSLNKYLTEHGELGAKQGGFFVYNSDENEFYKAVYQHDKEYLKNKKIGNGKKMVGYVKLGYGPTFKVYEKDGQYFDGQDLPISKDELETMNFIKDTNIKMNEKIRNSAYKKKDLKMFLREIGLPQDELYYKTGMRFEDVKTREDFEEVKRLLGQTYWFR